MFIFFIQPNQKRLFFDEIVLWASELATKWCVQESWIKELLWMIIFPIHQNSIIYWIKEISMNCPELVADSWTKNHRIIIATFKVPTGKHMDTTFH